MGAIRANEVTAIRIGVFHAACGAWWDCVVRHIEILAFNDEVRSHIYLYIL
jgi:hypothetical protein